MQNEKIKLSGFNNLTKKLNFNLYDFKIALNENQRGEYINYIHEKYNANSINSILSELVKIIGANILSVSVQDYDPVGSSIMILMSDVLGSNEPFPSAQLNYHLDKSHITAHTYPDISDKNGICSFRLDIDISTCGNIVPLIAVNYLFESFSCEIACIDYSVRGFTRLENGDKIYNDYQINSIRDFIKPGIIEKYGEISETNISIQNSWQMKLISKPKDPAFYFLKPEDIHNTNALGKWKLLKKEMYAIYSMS